MRLIAILTTTIILGCTTQHAQPTPKGKTNNELVTIEIIKKNREPDYIGSSLMIGIRHDESSFSKKANGVIVHVCNKHGVYAVTNYHVIDDRGHYVAATFPYRNNTAHDFKVVSIDKRNDAALLRLDMHPTEVKGRISIAARSDLAGSEHEFILVRARHPYNCDITTNIMHSMGRFVYKIPSSYPEHKSIHDGDSGSGLYGYGLLVGILRGSIGPAEEYINNKPHYNLTVCKAEFLNNLLRAEVGNCKGNPWLKTSE